MLLHEAKTIQADAKSETSDKLVDLFRVRELRHTFLIMGNIFCATSMIYYGLSYNAAGLPGSVHVNNAVNSAVEVRFFPTKGSFNYSLY